MSITIVNRHTISSKSNFVEDENFGHQTKPLHIFSFQFSKQDAFISLVVVDVVVVVACTQVLDE